MRVALVDYGVGNLRSVMKALETTGAEVILTDDPAVVLSADKVVLPGVGAFSDGMDGMQKRGLVDAVHKIVERQIPLLGICLGMQLFFDKSSEMGESRGLGLIPGTVEQFACEGLKIPHTGWNQLHINHTCAMFSELQQDSYVYFNHSYYCAPDDPAVNAAETDYGIRFISAVQSGSIYGVQFHPEKSQGVGLSILKNFVEVCQ